MRCKLLRAEHVRPVVLAADELEPLVRRVGDVDARVLEVRRRPREARDARDRVAPVPNQKYAASPSGTATA